MLPRLGTAALLFLATIGTTHALERSFPQDVRDARMSYIGERSVVIDGYSAELTVGAQIRDRQNFIIMPSALPSHSLVRFQEDAEGRVHRVWILRADEAAQPVTLPGKKLQRQ